MLINPINGEFPIWLISSTWAMGFSSSCMIFGGRDAFVICIDAKTNPLKRFANNNSNCCVFEMANNNSFTSISMRRFCMSTARLSRVSKQNWIVIRSEASQSIGNTFPRRFSKSSKWRLSQAYRLSIFVIQAMSSFSWNNCSYSCSCKAITNGKKKRFKLGRIPVK